MKTERPYGANKILTLDMILGDKSDPPPAIIGRGILPRESLLLIQGPPKAGKTFLATNIAAAIAAGESFACFQISKPHRVLQLSAEGGYYQNRDRLQRIAERYSGNQHFANNFHASFDWRRAIDDPDGLFPIMDMVYGTSADVVILDPFVRFHSGDENKAGDMAKILGEIRRLIEDWHISVILVHHQGKVAERGARGSSVIAGEYDSSLGLRRVGSSHELTFDLRHAESPAKVNMVFDPETFWFSCKGDARDKDKVVTVLRAAGIPLTKNDLVTKLQEADFFKLAGGAYKAIDRSKKKGYITIDTSGRYLLVA